MDDARKDEIRRAIAVNSPIEKLKRQLDFDNKIASDNRKIIVKYDWANFFNEKYPDFSGLHIENLPWRSQDALGYFFQGDIDGHAVNVEIMQASNILRAAEYFIYKIEPKNSMGKIFYIPSDTDLGTVSVQSSKHLLGKSYIWMYKNICFDVSSENPEAALALSKMLQSLAEKHVVQIAD